jgi:hypothetical protein
MINIPNGIVLIRKVKKLKGGGFQYDGLESHDWAVLFLDYIQSGCFIEIFKEEKRFLFLSIENGNKAKYKNSEFSIKN